MRLQRDLACFVEQYHIMVLDFILVWWWKEILWVSIFPISEKIKGVFLRILLTIRGWEVM